MNVGMSFSRRLFVVLCLLLALTGKVRAGKDKTPKETEAPSLSPSTSPTPAPTTPEPTSEPSSGPTGAPTPEPVPSASPTSAPTGAPTSSPSAQPTATPTVSFEPTSEPSENPTGFPTAVLSEVPTIVPTSQPSGIPTLTPLPSATESAVPSLSLTPSTAPSDQPSRKPSGEPSLSPSVSDPPSLEPSVSPSGAPSAPTIEPSSEPTVQESFYPTSVSGSLVDTEPTTVSFTVADDEPVNEELVEQEIAIFFTDIMTQEFSINYESFDHVRDVKVSLSSTVPESSRRKLLKDYTYDVEGTSYFEGGTVPTSSDLSGLLAAYFDNYGDSDLEIFLRANANLRSIGNLVVQIDGEEVGGPAGAEGPGSGGGDDDSLSGGAIAGITIACVGLVAAAGAVLWQSKKFKSRDGTTDVPEEVGSTTPEPVTAMPPSSEGGSVYSYRGDTLSVGGDSEVSSLYTKDAADAMSPVTSPLQSKKHEPMKVEYDEAQLESVINSANLVLADADGDSTNLADLQVPGMGADSAAKEALELPGMGEDSTGNPPLELTNI